LLGRGEGERGTQKEEGKGEGGKKKKRGRRGGYIQLKKNKNTTLHRPTTTQWLPQGSSPQGPPEGRGAALQWPHATKKGP